VRDAIDNFRAIDTEPFGVNQADAASHQAFIDAEGFPFDLLVDEGLTVARAYGALKPEGNRISRTVVIVGKDGRVLFRAAGAPPPSDLLAAIHAAPDEADGGGRPAAGQGQPPPSSRLQRRRGPGPAL
jgi:peroxiredoxin